MHLAVRQLRGQLDLAMARIKTLETELKHGTKTKPDTNVSGPEDWIKVSTEQFTEFFFSTLLVSPMFRHFQLDSQTQMNPSHGLKNILNGDSPLKSFLVQD